MDSSSPSGAFASTYKPNTNFEMAFSWNECDAWFLTSQCPFHCLNWFHLFIRYCLYSLLKSLFPDLSVWNVPSPAFYPFKPTLSVRPSFSHSSSYKLCFPQLLDDPNSADPVLTISLFGEYHPFGIWYWNLCGFPYYFMCVCHFSSLELEWTRAWDCLTSL